VYGFVYVVVGTTLHEQTEGPPVAVPALLCLWCTREEADGDSYPLTDGSPAATLPDALRRFYPTVFDPSIPLPGMLTPTPH
jgi:hypothetical protein